MICCALIYLCMLLASNFRHLMLFLSRRSVQCVAVEVFGCSIIVMLRFLAIEYILSVTPSTTFGSQSGFAVGREITSLFDL